MILSTLWESRQVGTATGEKRGGGTGTYTVSDSKESSNRGSGSQVVISHVAVGPPTSSALRRGEARFAVQMGY